jgi:Protein of unknown function (DUF992)
MLWNDRRALICAVTLATAVALGAPAQAADKSGVKTGLLSCQVSSGWGFIFGSSRDLNCTYTAEPTKRVERYTGKISKFGIDIGYLKSGVIIWAVFAPTTDLVPGALAGDYGGVTAEVSAGVGAGANVLIGGSNKAISLQPLSIEGTQGANVAAGIAAISLKYEK